MIDLAWVHIDCANFVCDLEVIASPVSDHLPIVLSLNFDVPPPPIIPKIIASRIRVTKDNAESFSNILLNSPIASSFDELKCSIVNACRQAGMFYKPTESPNKSWFDAECRSALKISELCYKLFRSCPSEAHRISYVDSKREYMNVVKLKKRLYLEDIQLKLSDCKSRSAFWKAINLYRNKKGGICEISKANWEAFYDVELGSPDSPDIVDIFPVVGVEDLDYPFTLEEYMLAVYSLNPKKSPGPDSIPNSVLRSIPIDSHQQILSFFNSFYESGVLPSSFGEIEMVMIHKKGDKSLPDNFRGIALVNTLTKLFTSIICNRLSNWAESTGKLPETQAGFRKGRGCLDQIFSLMCIVQIKLRDRSIKDSVNKYGKLYALFVDLRRAFDSINHTKLWRKLYSIGVSTKVINIISSL